MSRFIQVVHAIGRVTLLEILRDKILYNVFLFALLIFGMAYLAARLTFIRPERVILDFGVSAIGLSTAMIAILWGASLLNRDAERRTAGVALSRPISRMQFVTGKFSGLAAALFLNWLFLCGVFMTLLASSAEGALLQNWSLALTFGLILLLLQSWLLSAVAVLVSTIATTSLSVVILVGIYLIGNNISQLRWVTQRVESRAVSSFLDIATSVLPNLEHFNLGSRVTYGLPVAWSFVLASLAYWACATTLALILSGLLMRNKEM